MTRKNKRGASVREHLKMLAQLVKADGCSSALDFWFSEACNEHDVYYRTGEDCNGKPITRKQADALFFESMQRDAITPVGKWILAPMYWGAVRIFGKRHYHAKVNA